MTTHIHREEITRTDGSKAVFFTITAPGMQVSGCYPPHEAEIAIEGHLKEANFRMAIEIMKRNAGSTRGCIVT